MLKSMPVAEFYTEAMAALRALGADVRINEMPNEIADPIRFSEDTVHASYDAAAVVRFHRVLLSCHDVFTHFRTGFLGKYEPGAFLLGQL